MISDTTYIWVYAKTSDIVSCIPKCYFFQSMLNCCIKLFSPFSIIHAYQRELFTIVQRVTTGFQKLILLQVQYFYTRVPSVKQIPLKILHPERKLTLPIPDCLFSHFTDGINLNVYCWSENPIRHGPRITQPYGTFRAAAFPSPLLNSEFRILGLLALVLFTKK